MVSNAFLSVLFADDTNLFISGHDIETLCNKINKDLEKIQEWLCANNLSLNVMKTHYMVFTSRNKSVSDIDIRINDVSIERVYVTKFSGILIDSQLNWKHHIAYTCKKLSKCIGILSKAKKNVHKPSLITLYYSFAYSYMIYCNQVWGNKCANNLSLNVMKTHYMVFTSRNKSVSDIDIRINDVSIERVYVTKFSGILIDSQLNWKHHIAYTCKKLSKCIGILSKAKKNVHKPSLITLYYSFAYSYMIYCNQVWGNNYPTIINKLVLIQKKTCKDSYLFPLQSPHRTIDVCQQNFITNWHQYISYWNIYVSVQTQRRS